MMSDSRIQADERKRRNLKDLLVTSHPNISCVLICLRLVKDLFPKTLTICFPPPNYAASKQPKAWPQASHIATSS